MEGVVVRLGVRAPAVVVHLHEAGLGLLVDLRPTDPSLATLAVDGQALLLDEETPNQFLTDLILLEWEGGGGHGHTHFSSKASLLFWEREGMVLRIVVGAPAVVVHLHEVRLGHLADLRPTAPSLATLAVDRQALLLDKEAPNQFLTRPPLSGM